MDPKITQMDAQLAQIEKQRAERTALLADPEYQRIRQLYQNLANALDALDEAGERPTDGDGCALYVTGKSFDLSSNGEIQENAERWKRPHGREYRRTGA